MYGLKKRPKDESGLIQGAGTGTSDDVKKNVPAGSYIMPADSTQKIGTDNLKNMGSPTPVNLSNGEFQLSPDQVHSVGVQTLERMKDATHTPVPDQQGLGFKPGAMKAQSQQSGEPPKLGFNPAALGQYQDNIKIGESGKPELFFANGGEVEWDATDKAKAIALGGGATLYGATKVADAATKSLGLGPTSMGQMAKGVASAAWDGAKTLKSKPIPGVSNMGGASKLGAFGALATTAADTATTPTEQYRERFGLGAYNPDDSNGILFAKDLGVRALGAASDLGNNMTLGLSGKYYRDKQRIDQENHSATPASTTPPPVSKQQPDPTKAPDPAAQAAEKAKADAAAKAAAITTPPPTTDLSQQNTKQPTSVFADTLTQNTAQAANNPYAIQQKGNSFSYANPSAAAEARSAGVPELQRTGIQGGQGVRGIKEFMANTREMGASDQQIQDALARREMNLGLQGYGGIAQQPQVPERTPEQETQLQAEIKRVSTPIAGARGLTASQRNQINDLQQGYANRENDVYKTDANNAAALQREAMGQVGQNYRAELGEQGANSRFGANLGFEAQKFNATNDLANRQFSAEQLGKMPERMKQQYEVDLLQAYDKAQTDEERKPILEKLGALRGQTKQLSGDRFMSINGGQTMDKDGNITKAPDILIDKQTGSMHDYGAGQAQQLQPTQQMIEDLRKNPNLTNDFEHWFGKGSAAKYLG